MTILQLGHDVDCRRLYRMRLYLGPHTECQYAELLGYVTLQNGHFVFHLSNHNCNFRKSWKISRLVHVFVTCISRALHLFCASFHIFIFFLCSLSVISDSFNFSKNLSVMPTLAIFFLELPPPVRIIFQTISEEALPLRV